MTMSPSRGYSVSPKRLKYAILFVVGKRRAESVVECSVERVERVVECGARGRVWGAW
mgnify:CR=1 FL=1